MDLDVRRRVFSAGVVALGLAAAVGVPLVVAAAGCLGCDSDVCGSRLVIVMKESDTAALAPGTWEFEFVLDGAEPLLAACEIGDDSRSADCEPGDIDVSPIIVGDPDDPFTRFHVEIDGGIDRGTDDLPRVVELTVVHDGDVVVDEHIEPDYELSKPERCDADCFDDIREVFVARE